MWNLDRRLWNQYMQRQNERNPNSVNTRLNSIAYNKRLVEKQETADNKYNAVPNMRDAVSKVRQDKRTHSLNLINATGSKTKMK
tara:strand:+ start:5018 stop:5269 length:252 start_codon:yes stop_codon:yes gene_type:complete